MLHEHFRIFLLPLKRPHILSTTAAKTIAPPVPFLFIHLSNNLTRRNPATGHPRGPLGLEKRSRLSRLINWGEAKWAEYSEAPARSFKGYIYAAGRYLIDKVPVNEKQLWRLYLIKTFLESPSEEKKHINGIRIETGESLLSNSRNSERDLTIHLIQQMNGFSAYHRRWSLFNTFLIFPLLIMTILPFGKMVLAWCLFRVVAHWRAYVGAQWLVNALKGSPTSNTPSVKFTVNRVLDKYLPIDPPPKSFEPNVVGLADELGFGELRSVLPKAIEWQCKLEEMASRKPGPFRRRFSRQNLLDP